MLEMRKTVLLASWSHQLILIDFDAFEIQAKDYCTHGSKAKNSPIQ